MMEFECIGELGKMICKEVVHQPTESQLAVWRVVFGLFWSAISLVMLAASGIGIYGVFTYGTVNERIWGGIFALVCLGLAGFFFYTGWWIGPAR